MSGPNSYGQYFIRDSTSVMDDDAPVSTVRTWQMRQSMQHLIDMSPQHRVNWAGSTTNDNAWVHIIPAGETRIYSALFPHTWISHYWPCGLDIQLCGKTQAGTMSIDARVVPHTQGSSPLDVVDDPYWSATASTASTTSVELISDMYYPGTTVVKRTGWRPWTVFEGDRGKIVKVCLSRLDVKITRTGGGSTDTCGLTRVSVREFC